MLAHLWAKGPAPREYVLHRLSREFSCTPDVARNINGQDVVNTIIILNAEAQVKNRG